jgi:putative spermidine/putrescine transport system ATP-binding protein
VHLPDPRSWFEMARIISRSFMGASTRLVLEVEGQRLNAVVAAGQRVPIEGEIVPFSFSPDDLHIMDDAP